MRARRLVIAVPVCIVVLLAADPSPASAARQSPISRTEYRATGNPTPGTDLFGSLVRFYAGGTPRRCAMSPLRIPVTCVEHVVRMPSAVPTASGVTFGHWVYCRLTCTTSLLTHELVHVGQFERYGDAFGPMYLAEAAVNGTGCGNKWERPAYDTGGGCPRR